MTGDDVLLVKYRGGVRGRQPKGTVGHPYRFRAYDGTLDLFKGEQQSTRLKTVTKWVSIWSAQMRDVRAVRLDPLGGTRPNAAAVAAFGVAGLASRKANGVHVTIELGVGSLLVETKEPLPRVRALLSRQSSLAGKLHIAGDPSFQVASSGGDSGVSLSDELERLVSMRDAGHIDPNEFTLAKRRLLGA